MPGSIDGAPGGVHQKLLNQLRNCAPECTQPQRELSKSLSAQLGALRFTRNIADYQLAASFDEVQAHNACSVAQLVLRKV